MPLDINTLTALKRSTLGLDLYLWLVYRTFPLRAPLRLSWRQVYRQFGAHPDNASDKRYRSKLPHKGAPRVEEDQAGLAGVELRDRSGRPDPLALDSDVRSGGCVATAGPIAFSGSSGSGAPQAVVLRPGVRRPISMAKPKTHITDPTKDAPEGAAWTLWRALRPARAGGHRRSVVPEMPPGRQQKN